LSQTRAREKIGRKVFAGNNWALAGRESRAAALRACRAPREKWPPGAIFPPSGRWICPSGARQLGALPPRTQWKIGGQGCVPKGFAMDPRSFFIFEMLERQMWLTWHPHV